MSALPIAVVDEEADALDALSSDELALMLASFHAMPARAWTLEEWFDEVDQAFEKLRQAE